MIRHSTPSWRISPTGGAPALRFSQAAGLLAATGLATALLTACTSTSVMDLQVGQCLQMPTQDETVSVTTVECQTEHNAEVVGVIPLTESDLPSVDALDARATLECAALYRDYAGQPVEDASVDVIWLRPSAESWERGDRSLTCIALCGSEMTLTESLRTVSGAQSGTLGQEGQSGAQSGQ